MKLEVRELPMIEFRRDLPEYLAKGPCHIEIKARAAGAINPAYVAGVEQLTIAAKVMDRRTKEIADLEARTKAEAADVKKAARERFGVLFDACVMEWDCNILDDGKPMTCDRAGFLALADARVPEISAALIAFERECLDAGKAVLSAAEDAVKN